jgi:hypothetical protein
MPPIGSYGVFLECFDAILPTCGLMTCPALGSKLAVVIVLMTLATHGSHLRESFDVALGTLYRGVFCLQRKACLRVVEGDPGLFRRQFPSGALVVSMAYGALSLRVLKVKAPT